MLLSDFPRSSGLFSASLRVVVMFSLGDSSLESIR